MNNRVKLKTSLPQDMPSQDRNIIWTILKKKSPWSVILVHIYWYLFLKVLLIFIYKCKKNLLPSFSPDTILFLYFFFVKLSNSQECSNTYAF